MGSLRVALAQINTTVGDFSGNLRLIRDWIDRARAQRADLIIFPELTITGYPPEDLLLHPPFIDDNLKALEQIAEWTEDITAVVGFADRVDGEIFNSAAVFSDTKHVRTYHKNLLPNYEVFDEKRYFSSGSEFPVFVDGDVRMGVTICEDVWEPRPPLEILAQSGRANLLINISASPFHSGKVYEREDMMCERARDNNAYMAFCNLVGGQDELIFSGRSAIFSPEGDVIARAKAFDEDLLVADLELLPKPESKSDTAYKCPENDVKLSHHPRSASSSIEPRVEPTYDEIEAIYNALVMGTRDYLHKNGMRNALIGISGGIDSALVAAVAVDALGADHVKGVFMPSQYTSDESRECAAALCQKLGMGLLEVPIDAIFATSIGALKPLFVNQRPSVAEENMQSRIRGMILMALSNNEGGLVLTTGNKSEYALGYATLYGDMVGGLAVIKDLSKKRVYQLAEWRNREIECIPQFIIDRPPSAELRPEQIDEDDLPLPYDQLDKILEAYVERDEGISQLDVPDVDGELIKEIMCAVDLNEYKRRQSAPGLRITQKAFGKDRRYPLTNRYHHQD